MFRLLYKYVILWACLIVFYLATYFVRILGMHFFSSDFINQESHDVGPGAQVCKNQRKSQGFLRTSKENLFFLRARKKGKEPIITQLFVTEENNRFKSDFLSL